MKLITTIVGMFVCSMAFGQPVLQAVTKEKAKEGEGSKWNILVGLSTFTWNRDDGLKTESDTIRLLIAFNVAISDNLSLGGWLNRDKQVDQDSKSTFVRNVESREFHLTHTFSKTETTSLGISLGKLQTRSDTLFNADWDEISLEATANVGPKSDPEKIIIGASLGRGFGTAAGGTPATGPIAVGDCTIFSLAGEYRLNQRIGIAASVWIQNVEQAKLLDPEQFFLTPQRIVRLVLGVNIKF